MAKKYLDNTGLALVWEKIKSLVTTKVDKVDGKGLSSNDYTSEEKTKLAGVAVGAQVNVLEGIQKNGTTVTITNKIANISVPTKTSDITNDSGFITTASVPVATTTTPKMDGTAAVGTETTWAKGDHVHPTDTSRVPTSRKINGHALTSDITITKADIGLDNVDNTADANKTVASAGKLTTAVNLEGASFDGSSGTSYYATCPTAAATAAKVATIDGQTFNLVTGARVIVKFTYANSAASSTLNVNGTGAKSIYYNGSAIGKNVTDANGTYEFVYNGNQWELIGDLDTNTTYTAATATPLMDSGNGAVGTATKYAREDHVHPSDTTKVDVVEGKGLSTNDFTDAYKTKLDGVATGAEVNQNAFSNIKVGSTTVAADTKTDTLELVAGSNVTLTPDATNDKVTIAATDTVTTATTSGNGNAVTAVTASSGALTITKGKTFIETSAIGAASGVCPLDANSLIDSQYLPSFVDDIVEAYARTGETALSSTWLSTTSGGSALTPQTGVIYVLMADSGDYSANTQFRWSGTAYVKLNDGGVSPITNEEINTICV